MDRSEKLECLQLNVDQATRRGVLAIFLFLQFMAGFVLWVVINNQFHTAHEFKMVLFIPIAIFTWGLIKYILPNCYYLKLTRTTLIFRNGLSKSTWCWEEIDEFKGVGKYIVEVVFKPHLNMRPSRIEINCFDIGIMDLLEKLNEWKKRSEM